MGLSSKHYLQMWRVCKSKHEHLTTSIIWDFQRSILSKKEQELSASWKLYLDVTDPRSQVMEETDKVWVFSESQMDPGLRRDFDDSLSF